MRRVASALLALGLLAACGDNHAAATQDAAPTSLYDRLGGHAGLREVVVDFVGRLGADPKINGYFLNRSVDTDHLVTCLVAQLGAATGGPEVYPDPALGCRDMATAHQGLGISTQDFDDLLGHLVDALTAAGAAPADIATIAAVLQPMADDVVEDPGNDATVYQRVGRKPAIAAVVTDFEARVAADDRVNGFFATVTDFTRLHACLTRQVCGIDGPCRYGEEEAAEFAPLVNQAPCRSMAETHVGLMSGASVITIDDFNAIAENLVAALTAAGVATGDIDAIVGAIAPLCDQIVAGGVGCAP